MNNLGDNKSLVKFTLLTRHILLNNLHEFSIQALKFIFVKTVYCLYAYSKCNGTSSIQNGLFVIVYGMVCTSRFNIIIDGIPHRYFPKSCLRPKDRQSNCLFLLGFKFCCPHGYLTLRFFKMRLASSETCAFDAIAFLRIHVKSSAFSKYTILPFGL